MQYLLDTSDIDEIRKALDIFPLAGVTTNPTSISKTHSDVFETFKEISLLLGNSRMLHIHVIGETCDEMLRDADAIADKIRGNLYISVPVTPEGYKAMGILKKRGFKVMATAIYTPGQALLAANYGVDFVAPFVNRIDNISGMGVSVVKMTAELFNVHQLNTKVMAASFKNVQQVNDASLAGCSAMTIHPEVMWKVAEHPLTDMSVEQFCADWAGVYGEDKHIFNL